MNTESEVDFSSNSLTPLWRRRSTPQPQLLGRSAEAPVLSEPQRVADHGFPGGGPRDAPAAQTVAEVPGASDGRTVHIPCLYAPIGGRVTNGSDRLPRSTGLSLLGFDGPSHPKSPEWRRAAPPSPQRTAQ